MRGTSKKLKPKSSKKKPTVAEAPEITREECIKAIVEMQVTLGDDTPITRNAFRDASPISVTHIEKLFGSFAEFRTAAGLDRPTTGVVKKSKNEVSYEGYSYTREQCFDEWEMAEARLNEPKQRPDGSWTDGTSKELTRKGWRDHSEIPECVLLALFGSFIEFKRAAGKQLTRAHQTMNTAIARASAADNLNKAWAERLSYGKLYERDSQRRHQVILGFNDLHDIECDAFMLRVMLDVARRVQPEKIVSNGDHFDCPEFGKYPNDPREWDVVGRIKAGLKIFADFRAACPNAQIDLIEGNHEARVIRFFTEVAPALKAMLSDLHGLGLRELFGLDKSEVNYKAKNDLSGAYTDAHIKSGVKTNFAVYYDCVVAHHFPPARFFGMPGWNGHHHSHHSHQYHSLERGSYEWHQFAAGHRRDATYTDGQKWANGFGLIHVDTVAKQVQIEYIPVGTTMCIVGGKRYVRRPEEFYDALFPPANREHIIPFPED
jgi:hypothetical protein